MLNYIYFFDLKHKNANKLIHLRTTRFTATRKQVNHHSPQLSVWYRIIFLTPFRSLSSIICKLKNPINIAFLLGYYLIVQILHGAKYFVLIAKQHLLSRSKPIIDYSVLNRTKNKPNMYAVRIKHNKTWT